MSARSERAENAVLVVALLAVGGMAGAASFTHMHDWTMANVPAKTPDWFGWANALVSELTPLAAGLEIRRRRRNGQAVGYPVVVLLAAVALSLAAQFGQAKEGISGWLLAAVPALGFLAMVKLVLSRTPARAEVEGRKSTPARAEVPAEVWAPVHVQAPAKPEAVAEVPALPQRKAEAEAPQVNAQFPAGSKAELPPVRERKQTGSSTPARRKLALAKRPPETVWAAAQEVMADDPELPLKTVAERVGVSDRRLRQIRTEMASAVS